MPLADVEDERKGLETKVGVCFFTVCFITDVVNPTVGWRVESSQ